MSKIRKRINQKQNCLNGRNEPGIPEEEVEGRSCPLKQEKEKENKLVRKPTRNY